VKLSAQLLSWGAPPPPRHYDDEDDNVAVERSNVAALADIHFGSAMMAYHRQEDAFRNSVVLHNLTRIYRAGTLGCDGSRLAALVCSVSMAQVRVQHSRC